METSDVRMGVLAVVVLALFGVLFGRLWFLQVVNSAEYEAKANRNIVRTVLIAPPRGRILDRNGIVLAGNRASTVVTIQRDGIKDSEVRTALFARIAPVLRVTPETLEKRYNNLQYQRLADLPLAEDVEERIATYLSERIEDYPGIDVSTVAVRTYPFGSLGAHILGYVGRIPEDPENPGRFAPTYATASPAYQPTDLVGITGIERVYEPQLRGTPGFVRLEVNARGQVIRRFDYREPVPGNDVVLTIDAKLQNLAEQALKAGLESRRTKSPRKSKNDTEETYIEGETFQAPAGTVIVQDSANGDVTAMASYPTFDPRELTAGISSARSAQLNSDETLFAPLFNRAIQGEYAPGSTFKLVSGLGALAHGLSDGGPYVDTGKFELPIECNVEENGRCVWRNAGQAAYGTVTMARAMTVSSDAYFYNLGFNIWYLGEDNPFRMAIQNQAGYLGFGQPTGIQLPNEADGFVPSPVNNRRRYENNPDAFSEDSKFYSYGANINLAVGQGDMLSTPLQLVNSYSTFANGGTRWSPNLVDMIVPPGTTTFDPEEAILDVKPRALATLAMPSSVRDPMMEGLTGVISQREGTAFKVFTGFPLDQFPLAGKTGTAQVFVKVPSGKFLAKSVNDTSLFIAFEKAQRPFEPQYTIGVVMERSGFGSQAAAPVTRLLYEALLTETCIPAELEPAPPFKAGDPIGPGPLPESCSLVEIDDQGTEVE